jgi:hypothetical protein
LQNFLFEILFDQSKFNESHLAKFLPQKPKAKIPIEWFGIPVGIAKQLCLLGFSVGLVNNAVYGKFNVRIIG